MAFGWLKKAVKGATGAVASVGRELSKVPIVGKGVGGVFTLTIGAPFQLAHSVASGQRIDRAVLGHLKSQVAAARAVAPYAQAVVGLVPGVGQGVAGAIGASLALAGGAKITDALVEGVKGAIPGGAVARAAFDVGTAVVQGRPIEQAALAALPLNAAQKRALATGLAFTKDLAHGKRVDAAVVNRAMALLPPEAQKAVQIGIAVGNGQVLQATKAAGKAPAVVRFRGLPALAIGRGSAVTGAHAVRRIVGAKNKKVAAAIVLNTVAMAKHGSPVQRKLAFNALSELKLVRAENRAKRLPALRLAAPKAQPLQLPAPTAQMRSRPLSRWNVSRKGRVRRVLQ